MECISTAFVSIIAAHLLAPGHQRTCCESKPGQAIERRWSGRITMEETFTGQLGTSKRNVTVIFNDALPTLHRDDPTTDLNFLDDKGSGSVTFHSETFVGGKKWTTTDCSGSGQSEMHEVVLDEEDNVYSFHAIGPACNGQIVNHLGGPTETYGPEFSDISISNESLINENVLAGSHTATADVSGMGTVTTTITWNLTRSIQAAAELIVTPAADYDTWLPKPGQTEMARGSEIDISFRLQGINGAPLKQKAREFYLQLVGTSVEPGVALNYPLQPMNPSLPDLRFLAQQNAALTDQFQNLKITCSPPCDRGTATITAHDGGGYSSLIVSAVLEDGSRITGMLYRPGGITEIPIPKRKGSMIAEAWLNANGNPGDFDDKEETQENNNHGDGLSAYEEYRGVWSEGNYKRLDPQKKELGIAIPRISVSQFQKGMSWFENATKITIVRFAPHEISGDRKLNRNYASAHLVDQHALVLQPGFLPGGVLGRIYSTTNAPGTPAKVYRITIDVSQVPIQYNGYVNYKRPQVVPFSESDLLANTVAHEISHGVNVQHHGRQPNENSPQRAESTSIPVFYIYDYNGREKTQRPFDIDGTIGIAGNEQSGDLSCFVAYNPYCDWVYQTGIGGGRIFYEVPVYDMGTELCNTPSGSLINTRGARRGTDFFGDAPRGDCIHQVKVKD